MVDRLAQPAHKGAMKTIKLAVIAGILLLIACITRAAEPTLPIAPEATEYYRAGEFQIEGFYATRTEDFEKERGSTGIGVGYYLTEQFGGRFTTSIENFSGPLIDNVSAHLLYRIIVRQSAVYGYGGSTFLIDPEEFTVDLGLGLEHRFTPRFGPFVEAGIQKQVDHGAEAVGRVGVRLNF